MTRGSQTRFWRNFWRAQVALGWPTYFRGMPVFVRSAQTPMVRNIKSIKVKAPKIVHGINSSITIDGLRAKFGSRFPETSYCIFQAITPWISTTGQWIIDLFSTKPSSDLLFLRSRSRVHSSSLIGLCLELQSLGLGVTAIINLLIVKLYFLFGNVSVACSLRPNIYRIVSICWNSTDPNFHSPAQSWNQ